MADKADWIAQSDYKPGDVIFEETCECPFVHPLGCGSQCFNCLCPLKEEKGKIIHTKCDNCEKMFCSENCKLSDLHKEECSFICMIGEICAKSGVKSLDMERLIRVLCECERKKMESTMEMLKNLPANPQQDSNYSFNIIVCEQLQKLFNAKYQTSYDQDGLLHLLSALKCHSLTFERNDLAFATAISKAYAEVPHSCQPAASLTSTPNFRAILRALRPIQKNEPITIAHIETAFLSKPERMEKLKHTRGICCTCPMCSSATECGTFISAVKATSPCEKCSGEYIGPQCTFPEHQYFKVDTAWHCCGCGAERSSAYSDEVDIQLQGLKAVFEMRLHSYDPDRGLSMLENAVKPVLALLHPQHTVNFSYHITSTNVYAAKAMNESSDKAKLTLLKQAVSHGDKALALAKQLVIPLTTGVANYMLMGAGLREEIAAFHGPTSPSALALSKEALELYEQAYAVFCASRGRTHQETAMVDVCVRKLRHQLAVSTCALCGEPADKRCARCKAVGYCSREHQQSHWKTHKKECGKMGEEVAVNLL